MTRKNDGQLRGVVKKRRKKEELRISTKHSRNEIGFKTGGERVLSESVLLKYMLILRMI